MSLREAAMRHWYLVLGGAIIGAVLALVWTFDITWVNQGGSSVPEVTRRSPETYSTTYMVLVDTSGFGIGRADANVREMTLLTPTYAQLLVSEPVLQSVETSLGAELGAEVSAKPTGDGPMIKLTVEGPDRARLATIATQVISACRDYIARQQALKGVPEELRLTVAGVGQPSKPEKVSSRQLEIAMILLCLPVALALGIAVRLERSEKPEQDAAKDGESRASHE